MYRKVAVIPVLLLILSIGFTSCASRGLTDGRTSETAELSVDTDGKAIPKETLLASATEPQVVTIAGVDNWYSPASYESGLPLLKDIEEKMNINIKWITAPWDQYFIMIQTKLAAGVNLPDILRVPNSDPTSYGQAGLLLPLEELIRDNAPNIKDVFKKYPEAKKMMYSGDGHIYGLTPITRESSAVMPPYWVIRKDWLDKLELEVPQTLDSLYNVLQAFKENDPNRNGKPDEIPWGGDPEAFAEAFGLHLTFSESLGGFSSDGGKVIYQYTDPRYKEYLAFVNRLYSEGLMDRDYGSPNAGEAGSQVTRNLVGVMQNWPDLTSAWAKILRSSGDPDAHYIPFTPPAGPNGERSIESYGPIDDGFHSISKDCEDPILAIKLLDYLWSSEGSRYMAWGIEGKSYTIVDGKPQFTDYVLDNPDGLGASDALRKLGAWPTIPWVQQEDTYRQILSSDPDFNNCWDIIKPYLVEPFPKLLATKEQNDILMPLYTDISTYVKEMQIKFIIGKEPLADFDKYVQKVREMGLDEVLKIKQSQYDDFLNRK